MLGPKRLLTLLVAAGSLGLGAGALAQAPERDYLARPTPSSQRSSTGDYFVIAAKKGATVRQTLEIKSRSEVPLDLAITPVDALTAETGGVEYDRASEPADGVGSWIEVSKSEVRVRPGATVQVPFTVKVPRSARKGVNIGALVIQDPSTVGAGEAVQDRTVIAVQVDTPGPKVPDMAITGVAVEPRVDGLYLEVGISNNGTGFATGKGTLRIPEEAFESSVDFDTFVPGTAIGYPVRWTSDPVPGTYGAEVILEYGRDDRVVEWTGEIEVTQQAVAELTQLRGDDDAGSSGGIGLLPVLLGAGLLGVIAVAIIFGRRGKARPVTVPVEGSETEELPPAEQKAFTPQRAPSDGPGAKEAADRIPPEESTAPLEPTEEEEPTAEREPAKKTTAKKTTVKKSARKKSSAKKTTVKKTTAKKTTAKKTTARKTPAKRSTANKATEDPAATGTAADEKDPEGVPLDEEHADASGEKRDGHEGDGEAR